MAMKWRFSLGMNKKQAAGPVVETPLTILGSDLQAWWTADDPTSFDVSGGSVSAWRDKIGGRTLTQATSTRRPSYAETGFNGTPCFVFDGADDSIYNAVANNLTAGTTGGEIWALTETTLGIADNLHFIIAMAGSGSNIRSLSAMKTSGATKLTTELRVVPNSTNVYLPNNTDDYAGRHVMRGQFVSGRMALSIDGNAEVVSTGTITANSSASLFVGRHPSNLYFWNGSIKEIIVTAPLSTAKAAALQSYYDKKR